MNDFNYLICHKDHPIKSGGSNGGAEVATMALAKHMRKLGKRVFVAAQLDRAEHNSDGVEYWDLGPSFDTERALQRAAREGPFVLLSAGKAQPLVQAARFPECRARILLTHDRSGSDSGLKAPIVSTHCDAIVCVSHASRDVMVQAGAEQDKCMVINNGVDLETFTAANASARNWNQLVFAGALVQDKGIHFLIQSFIELKKKHPNLKLDVYGSASLWGREPFFDSEAIARDVAGITFHGNVPADRLADAYRRAGLLVYPSIWFEPFGMCASDALATGCPVVAFDVGGPRDILIDGKNGLLLKEISIPALTQALDSLLSHPQKLREMSEWILHNDRGRFDWNKVAREFEALAKRLVAKSRGASPQPKLASDCEPTLNGGQLGLLSTWNQACGLATYAQFLGAELDPRTFTVLAEEAAAVSGDESNVIRCWKRGSEDFSKLKSAIAARGIGFLLINAHYRFFPQPAFSAFLNELRASGIKSALILHNPYTISSPLQTLVRSVDRVLVHTAENRLEVIANGGDSSKVHAIPHGVRSLPPLSEERKRSIRRTLGLPESHKLLVCFGFIQAHKGMEGMIEALAHLRTRGIAACGLIAGSVMHDDPSSASYLNQLRVLAERLDVQRLLHIPNRFFAENEVSDVLQIADLVIMNYQSQHYEASGACALAIGAGALVATSIAPPFVPFGDSVWHVTSGFPVAIAAELLLTSDALCSEILAHARDYRERHAWRHIRDLVISHLRDLGFEPRARSSESLERPHSPPDWSNAARWTFTSPNPVPPSPPQQAPLPTLQAPLPTRMTTDTSAPRTQPQDADWHAAQGDAALEHCRWSEARDHYMAAIRVKDSHAGALCGLAHIAQSGGDKDLAWELFEMALKGNRENLKALLGLISLGYELGRLAAVERAIRDYLEYHPADLNFLYSLAGCLFAQNRMEEAAREVEKIMVFEPSHAKANELRAMIQSRTNGLATLPAS